MSQTMHALLWNGTTLTLERNYPDPQPAEGEALIRVRYAGICNTDLEITRGYMGFTGVPGHEFVGIVEDIYGEQTREQYAHLLGKRIVGEINAACYRADCFYCQHGMSTHCPRRTTLGIDRRDGAFAEYLMLPVENVHLVPDNVSDKEAVFVEPLAANFEILEQVHLKPTDCVVILGDGKMGQLAAQVLTLSGCELMMVGKHKEKLALAAQRGVLTHTLDDAQIFFAAPEQRADVVVECSGSAQGLAMALSFIRPRGTLILKSTVSEKSLFHLAPIVINEINVQGSRCGPFAPALRALQQHLIDVRPLISAHYTLEHGTEAFRKAEEKGILKVLISI